MAGWQWPSEFIGERMAPRRARALAVLDHIAARHRLEGLSLTEMAAELPLARSVIDAGVSDLLDLGWVVECPPDAERQGMGRPARRFRLGTDNGHVAGLDIDSETVRALVADCSGAVIGRAVTEVDANAAAHDRLAAARKTLMLALRRGRARRDELCRLVVGTTGIVSADGTVCLSSALPGWSGLDLAQAARQWVGPQVPVLVDNDCRLAALADQWRGALDAHATGVHILIGLRAGIGIVIDGRLHTGAHLAAGEIGMLRSMGWMRSIYDLVGARKGRMSDLVGRAIERAQSGDAIAAQHIDQFADVLVDGLAAVCLIIDPEIVAVGARFDGLAELVAPRLMDRLSAKVANPIPVLGSPVGQDTVAIGAIRYALDDVRLELARDPLEVGALAP